MTGARWVCGAAATTAVGCGLAGLYVGLVSGAVPVDLGVGRRSRRLGPQSVEIAAPQELVFDVVAEPYLGRATRAMREKLNVLERGVDLVLAEHFTPIAGSRLRAVTVEIVRFSRPERVDFRLVRGPVPHVTESFTFTAQGSATCLAYEGEMGADLWGLGQWWSAKVAARWEAAVADSLGAVKTEAEHRARHR